MTTHQHYFIVQHRATGKFMPQLIRGATWWEPTLDKETSPRLFAKRAHAANAAEWRERGAWRNELHRYQTEWGDDDEAVLTLVKPKVPRARGDLEVIEVELKLVGQMEMKLE